VSLGLCLVLTGCFRSCSHPIHADMTAEQVVESYLNMVFSMKTAEDKNILLSYTTGEMKAAIATASEETLQKAYLDRRYTLKSFSLVGKRDRTPHETEVTFQLEYQELPENVTKPEEAVMVKTLNTVALEKSKGGWLIREVIGAKSTFDFPLSNDSRIGPNTPTP